MKILYESDLAGSKYHGMAYRIYQFSKEFTDRGHEVMVVAASYSHTRRINPNVTGRLTNENIDGIQYKWIKTPKYSGNGVGRVLHMLLYNFYLWFYAKKIAREFKPNVVIASGVTPLDFIGCRKIAKKAGAKIFLEVGDLWPLSPIELGGYSPRHPFIKIMQWAENYSYRHTDNVISLLPCLKKYMMEHGLDSDKFNYIPNGIITSEWDASKELSEKMQGVFNKLKKENKFIIGYAGAHGQANDLNTIIDVVAGLKSQDVVLILIGTGQEKEKLVSYTLKHGIDNVYFFPAQEKELIPACLKQMDVLYIGLQKQPLFRFGISPNKMFYYMMASKPIIQAIDAGNNLVQEANCGLYAEPENVEAIARAILKLKMMSTQEREELGRNGHEYVLQNHAYNKLTERYLDLIKQV